MAKSPDRKTQPFLHSIVDADDDDGCPGHNTFAQVFDAIRKLDNDCSQKPNPIKQTETLTHQPCSPEFDQQHNPTAKLIIPNKTTETRKTVETKLTPELYPKKTLPPSVNQNTHTPLHTLTPSSESPQRPRFDRRMAAAQESSNQQSIEHRPPVSHTGDRGQVRSVCMQSLRERYKRNIYLGYKWGNRERKNEM